MYIEKSFYALEYTTNHSQDQTDQEETSLISEDYSKIIQELQSHRREIEKLQIDISSSNIKEDDQMPMEETIEKGFFWFLSWKY